MFDTYKSSSSTIAYRLSYMLKSWTPFSFTLYENIQLPLFTNLPLILLLSYCNFSQNEMFLINSTKVRMRNRVSFVVWVHSECMFIARFSQKTSISEVMLGVQTSYVGMRCTRNCSARLVEIRLFVSGMLATKSVLPSFTPKARVLVFI